MINMPSSGKQAHTGGNQARQVQIMSTCLGAPLAVHRLVEGSTNPVLRAEGGHVPGTAQLLCGRAFCSGLATLSPSRLVFPADISIATTRCLGFANRRVKGARSGAECPSGLDP